MLKSIQIKIVGIFFVIIALLAIGTGAYSLLEGWSLVDSFYFTGITLTTIGYGDLAPTHDASKIFTIFFAFAGVGVFLLAITTVSEYFFHRRLVHLKIIKNHKKKK